MKKVLYFSCLVITLGLSVVTLNAGVLKDSTNKKYADYVHEYSQIKKVAEQYENNIVLNHSDKYIFGYAGDFGDGVSEEEIEKSREPLGKYDAEYCVKYVGLDYQSLKDKVEKYLSSDSDSIKFSKEESTATSFFNYEFSYYYDSVRHVLIQYVSKGLNVDDDMWHNNVEYYVWNKEGVVTYEAGE